MLELWVGLAIAGAFAQNLRSLLQRRLTHSLSVSAASYVRFVYALPLAWLYCAWLGPEWPALEWSSGAPWLVFLGYCTTGGVAQIIGTFCLVAAVSRGGFAVGTAYSKTEAAQAALFGLVLLGDGVTLQLLAAIALSFVGVALLAGSRVPGAFAPGSWLNGRILLLGLGAGAGFALSAVCFRGAALSLDAGDAAQRAAATLAVTLTLQSLVQGVYLAARERPQLRAVFTQYRMGLWVGLAGFAASVCWFTAMAMHSAAEVRAVGQIEMLFTLLTGIVLLRERVRVVQLLGIAAILGGIYLLLS